MNSAESVNARIAQTKMPSEELNAAAAEAAGKWGAAGGAGARCSSRSCTLTCAQSERSCSMRATSKAFSRCTQNKTREQFEQSIALHDFGEHSLSSWRYE